VSAKIPTANFQRSHCAAAPGSHSGKRAADSRTKGNSLRPCMPLRIWTSRLRNSKDRVTAGNRSAPRFTG